MIKYRDIGLTESEEAIISRLLERAPEPLALEDLWHLMDLVWDELKCDPDRPCDPNITAFYRHPVWVLNGLFAEMDESSLESRRAIAEWTVSHLNGPGRKRVLDYGGGFGTLARLIAKQNSSIEIDIFEPHPSLPAIDQCQAYPEIRFVDGMRGSYDCLIAVDVLEHLPDPLSTVGRMIDAVRREGYLLLANNFYPVIKCHLPSTFYLRYSFLIFASLMGARFIGPCRGSHATVYKKVSENSWRRKGVLKASRVLATALFPVLDTLHRSYRGIKRRIQ